MNNVIKVIQGDTLNLIITVEAGAELIEDLWFSCKYLNISQKLSKINDTQYLATFNAEFTCDCKTCLTTYDITAILKDNQVSTVVYQNSIQVLKKENKINGN